MKAFILLLLSVGLFSCQSNWKAWGPGGEKAGAYCSTLSANGQQCAQWSDDVTDASLGEFMPSNMCCTTNGSECYVPVTMARNVSNCFCIMRSPNPYFPPQNVQGRAC
jgi:hypothetical protein